MRQAIAHCIDRDRADRLGLPVCRGRLKATLRMDSFLPKTHWAYSGPYTDLPQYDPAAGNALLDEAGWTLPDGALSRERRMAIPLALKFTNHHRPVPPDLGRRGRAEAAECGIQIIRQHTPASWWFGDTTGLARRDFELGAFAWVGQTDPSPAARSTPATRSRCPATTGRARTTWAGATDGQQRHRDRPTIPWIVTSGSRPTTRAGGVFQGYGLAAALPARRG